MKNVCHKKPVSPETFIHDHFEESPSHHRRSDGNGRYGLHYPQRV